MLDAATGGIVNTALGALRSALGSKTISAETAGNVIDLMSLNDPTEVAEILRRMQTATVRPWAHYRVGATRRPLPLRCKRLAEIGIVGGESQVQAPGFALDAERGELVPQVAQVDAAHVQHGARAGQDPAHCGAFHAVFDHTAASPFDDAGGDGEAVLEVDVIGCLR